MSSKLGVIAWSMRSVIRRLSPPYSDQYAVTTARPAEGRVSLGEAAAIHRQALETLVELDRWRSSGQAPDVARWLMQLREAVVSSAIAGIAASVDEVMTTACAGIKSNRSATYAANYLAMLGRLVSFAESRDPTIFTVDWLRDVHRALCRLDPASSRMAGRLRREEILAGCSPQSEYCLYNPPRPEDLSGCLVDTGRYLRCEGEQGLNQSIIVRLAIMQCHLYASVPFSGANGEFVRLISTVMMAADGHTPLHFSAFLHRRTTQYKTAVLATQSGDFQPLVALISQGVIEVGSEVLAVRARVGALVDHWLQRNGFYVGSAARRLIDTLPFWPVVTGKIVADQLALSPVPARHAINRLVAAGILSEITGYSRNRIFVAHDLREIAKQYCEDDLWHSS